MTRKKTVMVRLSDEEHERLSEAATGQGATLAGYLRAAARQQWDAGTAPATYHPAQQPPTSQQQPARSLAVLVDGDNAQATLLGPMLAEAAKHGIVTVRRIYGDWTSAQMSQWKQAIQTHAMLPVQQFRSVSGKNSTDMALAIDAVDLLHAADLGGVCIVSSDSDFTRLATRIREQGLLSMGIGRRDTPKAFVTACEIFVYTDNLHRLEPAAAARGSTRATGAAGTRRAAPQEASEWDPHSGTAEAEWTDMVADAAAIAQEEDGWTPLGRIGSLLRQTDPAFDPRSYGMPGSRLSLLVKSRPDLFEVVQTAVGHMMVRVLDDNQSEKTPRPR